MAAPQKRGASLPAASETGRRLVAPAALASVQGSPGSPPRTRRALSQQAVMAHRRHSTSPWADSLPSVCSPQTQLQRFVDPAAFRHRLLRCAPSRPFRMLSAVATFTAEGLRDRIMQFRTRRSLLSEPPDAETEFWNLFPFPLSIRIMSKPPKLDRFFPFHLTSLGWSQL